LVAAGPRSQPPAEGGAILVTTNSITQTFNRRVVQEFFADTAEPVSLVYAISDHP
jgi:hypothetical protein